ncbi:MAG: alpha/beta fold hydrolase [Proteobacteria bacterium]|nr:alpha/beta fold hydrolase [Pseudomonadota bacterium]
MRSVVMSIVLPLLPVVGILGCSSDPAPPRPIEYGGDRPTELLVPDAFDASKDYPLLLVLHGYGANGFVQKAYFQTAGLLASNDALVLAPDGTTDAMGNQFWNADPGCCDFNHTNVDDVGYLKQLVDDVMADYPVDPTRVVIVGHSNGGYMAYRLACDHAETFAAIGVLAGVASSTPATCLPSQPVSVLHMHGTGDTSVPFATAAGSVALWTGKDGCAGGVTPGPTLDLESTLPGAETTTATVGGCPAGVAIEQWSITGAGHIPNFIPTYGRLVFDWLTAHGR